MNTQFGEVNNPLKQVDFANFHHYVKMTGGTLCAGVKDANGKFHVIGDTEMMNEELTKLTTVSRRASREWVPLEKPLPKLPMPLAELLHAKNRNKVKQCASAFVRHFLTEDQQLGKVIK